ncbi:MAG TPA: PEP-CTERM sorting domain-containing protein [Candidatus Paceibacterota bacterium]|nr:PEP-CTERM sorting domain-containing protein [Candidatus Paceibacterota bacterium]
MEIRFDDWCPTENKRNSMRCKSFLAAIAALALALPALADWDENDPNTKWLQMPNMDNGYNVFSTWGIYLGGLPVSKVVADDWKCTDPAPVTDIHVWGSWWNDEAPNGWLPTFQLTIYSDIPASSQQEPYSQPGSVLWSRILTPAVRPWGISEGEMFYDPNGVLPLSAEKQVWQYNFLLAPQDYFRQQPGTVYWLSVQTTELPEGFYWGWKTSADHWNDAATWADLPGGAWEPLWDPRYQGPLDMAFVITTPEPATYALIAGLGLAAFAGCRRSRAR